MNPLEILFVVAVSTGTVVIVLSVFVIRRASKSPANGELKKIRKLEQAIEYHKKILKSHEDIRRESYHYDQHH